MSEIADDEFTRRLREVAASVAGLDEDEALALIDIRLKHTRANGQVRHRLSLARARGTLALALGSGAEPDLIASLQTMVTTIEESGPREIIAPQQVAPMIDPADPEYDPELAANLTELLECHHQNAVAILRLIASLSVTGTDPDLITTVEALLTRDLEAISELERR